MNFRGIQIPIYHGQRKDVNVKSLINKLISNELYEALHTSGDGNCLYNSISICLFGDDRYNWRLRLACLLVVFEQEEYFRSILKRTQPSIDVNFKPINTFQKFIIKIASNKTWGDDLVQIALSMVINRPIVYISTAFINNTVNSPYRISLASSKQLKISPIHIVLNESHYTALAPINNKINVLFSNTIFYNNYQNFILPDDKFE